MATALQNRLVGTIILVALAVIFLPDILDGKKTNNTDNFVDVPAQRLMRPIIEPEPFPIEEVKSATEREIEIVDESEIDDSPANISAPQVSADSPRKDTSLEDERPQDDVVVSEEALPENAENSLAAQTVLEDNPPESMPNTGWVVQLGSFRHQKNVKVLLDKLEKAGYRAFSRVVDTSAGRLTKVFVGPDVDKAKLENALPHLTEVTGLQGKITPFTVD